MAEYIEREAAEDAVGEAHLKGLNPLWELRDVPAADVAPVVHCGDCKHWKKLTSVNGYCTCAVGLREADLSDCFCSYGER